MSSSQQSHRESIVGGAHAVGRGVAGLMHDKKTMINKWSSVLLFVISFTIMVMAIIQEKVNQTLLITLNVIATAISGLIVYLEFSTRPQ